MNRQTIEVANRVLKTFHQPIGAEFFVSEAGRLHFRTKHGSMVVKIAKHSGALSGYYGTLGLGGTWALAVGQLARWLRGQSREPMRRWRYWASDRMLLCTNETVEILEASSYNDPKKTCCVLCGNDSASGDWWSLDGLVGPCCTYSLCQKQGPYDFGDIKCPYCSEKFDDEEYRAVSVWGDETYDVECEECGKDFKVFESVNRSYEVQRIPKKAIAS